MESRKRLRAEDGDLLQSKKRAVSDSRDSPVPINGVSDPDEPKDSDSLEVSLTHGQGPKTTVERIHSSTAKMQYSEECDTTRERTIEVKQRLQNLNGDAIIVKPDWLR